LAEKPTPAATASATPAATATASPVAPAAGENKAAAPKAEPKSEQATAVNPEVQSEVEKKAAEKRAQLLKDAEATLDETRKAVEALDQGKKDEALAALERVTGKLDLIVARDPNLALAPVSVATIVRDIYGRSDTAADVVKTASDHLDDGRVQEARALLSGLASEAVLQVTNIPLATYPAAIKTVAPLIDAGKVDEAKATLRTALNTLVVESYIIPLPKIRAEAMLKEAEKLAQKSDRNGDENKKLHDLIEGTRNELKLGETLGYGTKKDYKPLYEQLDDIKEKTQDGKSGTGFFDKIKDSLRDFKDNIAS
jgi:hypothetical protein